MGDRVFFFHFNSGNCERPNFRTPLTAVLEGDELMMQGVKGDGLAKAGASPSEMTPCIGR